VTGGKMLLHVKRPRGHHLQCRRRSIVIGRRERAQHSDPSAGRCLPRGLRGCQGAPMAPAVAGGLRKWWS